MPWTSILLHNDETNVTSTNCSDGVQWIYKYLGDCVWDDRGIASDGLGLASIFTWMMVSVPQMVKNFRHVQGIEGISFLLILMWTLGDTANLVGAILTKQLQLQIYLAIYFVFADLVLFAQFLYYNCIWKRKYRDYESIPSNKGDVHGTVPQVVLCISGALLLCVHKSLQLVDSPGEAHMLHFPAGRSLMQANDLGHNPPFFKDTVDEVGYGIGVVSSIFYTFSRVGQMWKNYKRKSTDGLSVLMFILAVLGNLTYGLSILVRQTDETYILRHLPWLIGSLGVIFLDLSLLVQFKYYGEKDDMDTLLKQPVTNSYNTVTDSEIFVPVQRNHTASIN